MLYIAVLILLHAQFASAQIFGSETKIQNDAVVSRIYIWDKPVADSLTYKDILPSDMKVVVGFNSKGKGVYILTPDSVFNNIVRWFEDTNFLQVSQTALVGFEFVVAEVNSFSWLSKKKIKKLSGMQKVVAEAFNESKKYTLMAQNPRMTFGVRDQNGNIVPVFGSGGGHESAPTNSIQGQDFTPKIESPKKQQQQEKKFFPPLKNYRKSGN